MHAAIDHELKQNPITSQNAGKCWSHFQIIHDIFLNHRVATEGKPSAHSLEPKRGMVQMLYESFANLRKQSGDPVFVFWDFKCLNFGQNWEQGFLNALKNSRVIVLLVSMKALEGIAKNAKERQDNVLVEYECAIIQNKLHKIPVIPVFLSEIENDDANGVHTHVAFDFSKAKALFPKEPHAREKSVQDNIDSLGTTLKQSDTHFLSSIFDTMREIFLFQACFLSQRGESRVDIESVVKVVMAALERHGPNERE